MRGTVGILTTRDTQGVEIERASAEVARKSNTFLLTIDNI